MKLESPKVVVEKNVEELFKALQDFNNYKQLMPENTSKFEVLDADCFEFALKGMPALKLVKKSITPTSEIVLGAASSKLPFSLTTLLNGISDEQTEVQLFFEGEFNAMMAMMIKKPISDFIAAIAQNMNKL